MSADKNTAKTASFEDQRTFSLIFNGTSYVCSVFVYAGVMGLQDRTLRPSLKDIDEELLHLVAEQSAANEMLAEKRQKDQALLDQMLPPQVNTTKPCRMAFSDHNHNDNNDIDNNKTLSGLL